LNLSLSNFATWLNIHIAISIVTLVTLLLKLAFHWRWIVHATRKIWASHWITHAQNAVAQPITAGSRSMGRREFLQVMGVVGTATFLALANASRGLAETGATTEADTTETDTSGSDTSEADTSETDTSEADTSEDVDAQTISNTVDESNSSTSSSSNSSCKVRCRKACSYPGHCDRYVDTNDNGRCDLGECS
jgi:hypothetical protein